MSDDFTRCRMMWLDQVYDDRELTIAVRDIAFRLSRYFNRKRFNDVGILNAWPSYELLASETGVTVKTVYRAISRLRERKHIETTEGRGRSRTLQYHAKIKPFAVADTVESPVSKPDKTRHECPVIEKKEDICAPKTGHLETVKPDTNVLQTSLKKSSIKSLSEPRANDPAFEPFKAGWSLVVFDALSKGHGPLPRPTTAFLRNMIEVEKRPMQVKDHQAKHGWPEINKMFERPAVLDGSVLASSVGKMALEMEPVTTGSALWAEWQGEFESRGWPFPREAKGMCFPRGGPRMLDAFMTALAARQAGSVNVMTIATKAVRHG
ncbi:helix-turn-helix domain-containing protein [Brucella pseudogrignonensis]|uniref:helix-turn-helix domain-containing protein n=1 Tax=Brucella pseudogrignonensis TaxID=419475 RepID=UPI001E3F8D5D|nr:helix-turn-helix domain-containing protein [Brucella pseudogrignonensis]MCD4514148.1 helix-turn-helix domain-containing protein [Brucella pseudogrignonensis]